MNQDQIRNLAVAQLTSLKQLAGNDISGTTLELQLNMAISSLSSDYPESTTQRYDNQDTFVGDHDDYEDQYDEYDGEDYEAPVPKGFESHEEFDSFKEQQQVEDEDIVSVTGTIPDGQGGYIQVGEDIEDVFADNGDAEADEEADEILKEEGFDLEKAKLSFSRYDGQELHAEDVERILANPVSESMKRAFGDHYRIRSSDKPEQKIVTFYIDETDKVSRNAMRSLGFGATKLQGSLTFPGIGMVECKFMKTEN